MNKSVNDIRVMVEELKKKLVEMNDEIMGDKTHTCEEWMKLIEENNKLHSEYDRASGLLKKLEKVEKDGVKVVAVHLYRRWREGDRWIDVEIHPKHRNRLIEIQDTIGEKYGLQFMVRV